MINRFRIRLVWYQYRKIEGYPISLWRAFTSDLPRFGSYEQHEAGCPEWAKRDYQIVLDVRV